MDFSSIFETIKGFFEANVLPTLKPIIDAIMSALANTRARPATAASSAFPRPTSPTATTAARA